MPVFGQVAFLLILLLPLLNLASLFKLLIGFYYFVFF
jgi:hypothetical protein